MAALFRNGPIITWLAWMVIIFTLSAQERPPQPDLGFSWQDKLQHAAVYAVLAFLTLRAAAALPRLGRFPTLLLVLTLVWAALYALSDEWHQSFVPGRDASALDWLADVVGAAMALPALRWLRRRRRGR
ncbi:MAG: VanZ family protein [Dehalococcoidia bacterium]|nr:VanZ family protein [Dehalococcoidia bacterium]